MNLSQSIRNLVLRHQPLRVIVKSLRNLFFPTIPTIDSSWTITIEISSVCDARCIFCNYRFGYRKKKRMSVELFEDVARSSVAAGFKYLDMTSFGGEIFTHKDVVRIMQIAKEAGFETISTFTNAIQLYRYDVDQLLNSGLDFLFISTPGFSEDIYERVFGVRRFSDFKKSIAILLETHKRLNSRVQIYFEPRTHLTTRALMKSEFWSESVSPYLSPTVHMSEPLRVFDTWSGDVKQKDLLGGMKADWNPLKSIYPLKRVFPCNRLSSIGILANGDVRLCNCRYDSSIETDGDALYVDSLTRYRSFEQLLVQNNEKIERIFGNFINGNLPVICRKCPFYIPVRRFSTDQFHRPIRTDGNGKN